MTINKCPFHELVNFCVIVGTTSVYTIERGQYYRFMPVRKKDCEKAYLECLFPSVYKNNLLILFLL